MNYVNFGKSLADHIISQRVAIPRNTALCMISFKFADAGGCIQQITANDRYPYRSFHAEKRTGGAQPHGLYRSTTQTRPIRPTRAACVRVRGNPSKRTPREKQSCSARRSSRQPRIHENPMVFSNGTPISEIQCDVALNTWPQP